MFGVSDPDFVMAFSAVPWESDKDRNAFLNELVHMNIGSRVRDGVE